MKKLLELVGGILLIAGVCGVVREVWPWFRLMGFTDWLIEKVGFLQGWELFAHIVIAVLGFLVLMIADGVRKA
ncbi:hypothetical protein [Streptomyces sp. NPDC046887]|uniref:hypothetical protein n=1 Tax=Streptomyces sp. NPDC046887 TaxID=3155472 RepID=UPI0033C4DE44